MHLRAPPRARTARFRPVCQPGPHGKVGLLEIKGTLMKLLFSPKDKYSPRDRCRGVSFQCFSRLRDHLKIN